MLRLKSTLERALRLSTTFTSQIASSFQSSVSELGRVFRIDKHSVDVFSESFIRSHLMFQFAKSIETMLAWIRTSLNLPPFIIISPAQSKATGVTKFCSNIYEVLKDQHCQFVVFLENADGTEEIPANTKGVVLRHDLP